MPDRNLLGDSLRCEHLSGDPLSSDALLDHVRLASLPGVGPRMRQLLLERFGTPTSVFAADLAELAAIPGIGRKLPATIRALAGDTMAAETLAICRDRGVRVIPAHTAAYPGLLGRIDDPPSLLFVRGELEPCDALAVAIVGARHATPYGNRVAHQLAAGLARAGYTVVSGLARGIDAAAHRGALDAGGRTIAVLGTGVLNIYPPEHADLAVEVMHHGAVISEAPPYAEASRGVFPQRNRIVSGLSLGTVVVQASERSGALITARLAGEQGREVFAVPGAIDCRMSRGCHALIRDGAKLVESVDDILDELGPLFETTTAADGRAVRAPAELRLDDVERRVLEAIDAESAGGSEAGGSGAADIDTLVVTTGLTASQVLATVGVLEMRRIVRRLPGSRVGRM
jgi:DNA processing protein